MNPKSKSSLNEIYVVAAVVLVLVILGSYIGWLFARSRTEKIYRDKMTQVADIARSGLPYFFETGKSLIGQKSDFNLSAVPAEFRNGFLAQISQTIPFFQQILLLDAQGTPLASYPDEDLLNADLTSEDLARVRYLANGQSSQIYVVAPKTPGISGLVSFMHAIQNGQNDIQGILLGRTDLLVNPQSKPFVQSFETLVSSGGNGIILDEYQRIIFTNDAQDLLKEFKISQLKLEGFTPSIAVDGRKSLIYAFSIPGQQWTGVLSVPESKIGFSAFLSEIPFILGLLVISGFLVFLYSYFFRRFERPIKTLADRAGQIAEGKSEVTFGVNSSQQVRELDHSLENMRKNLNERIQELTLLNQIPLVTAPEKDLEKTFEPYLSAALHFDADAARLILLPEVSLQNDQTERIILFEGGTGEIYSYLDDQIIEYVRNQNLLILPNTARIKQLKFMPGYLRPGALVALPITMNAGQLAGVLIVLFDQARNFTKAEIQFYSDLLEKLVALLNLIRERNRDIMKNTLLEKIFTSSEDPMLYVDKQGKVLLQNKAASLIKGLTSGTYENQRVEDSILLRTIRTPDSDLPEKTEIQVKNGKVYFVYAKNLDTEIDSNGKILLLKDRSLEKQRTALQSDFISIVSHDLRSPLTLAKGYVNMLEMVGSLNDQQKNFVNKISNSVDHMSRLANNLLDLERFEIIRWHTVRTSEPTRYRG